MPRYQHPHNQTPPDPPDVCEIAGFPVAVVPYALGALESRTYKYSWSDEGYVRGVQLIRSLQMAMLCGSLNEITDRQDQLYRLLDTALNGRVYTVESTEPLVITPTITDVPEPLDPPAGMVANLDELPGILDPGWFGYGGHKATLADIVRALRVGDSSTSDSIVSQLNDILGAGANVAELGELVIETFTAGVDSVAEGGIFVLLAAGIVGQLASTGALSAQITNLLLTLNRIVKDLDGGGLFPPGDNILQALRGDVEASATRNVIDSENTIIEKIQALVDDLESEHAENANLLAKLEEIRALLV